MMPYDREKYREKREKVLGVKSRGLSFGKLATLVSICIVVGLGAVVLPKVVSYFSTRNLDDAIYKMADASAWDQELVLALDGLAGVKQVITDNDNTRLVVTYNRLRTDTKAIENLFKNKGVKVDLLNEVDHRHRLSTLKKEAEFEAL